MLNPACVEGLENSYINQLWPNIGCNWEDLPRAMNDRDRWWESTTKWWYAKIIGSNNRKRTDMPLIKLGIKEHELLFFLI